MCKHLYETIGFEFEDGLYYWRDYHKDLFKDIELIIPKTNDLVMLSKNNHFKISADLTMNGIDLEIKSNRPVTFYNAKKKENTKLSDTRKVLKDYVLFYKDNMYSVLKGIEKIEKWTDWKDKNRFIPIGFNEINNEKVCMLYSVNPLKVRLDKKKTFSKAHNLMSSIAPQATISMDVQKVWKFFSSPFPFFKEYQIEAITEVINVRDEFDKKMSGNILSDTFWGFIAYLNIYLNDAKENKKNLITEKTYKADHGLFLRLGWSDYWKIVMEHESSNSKVDVQKTSKKVVNALWKNEQKKVKDKKYSTNKEILSFSDFVDLFMDGKKELSDIFDDSGEDIVSMNDIYEEKLIKDKKYIFMEIRNMRGLKDRHYNVTECMVIVTCLFDWLSRFHKAKIKPLKTLTYKKIKKVRAEIKKQLKNDWVEKDDLEELLKNLAPKKKKEE